MDWHGGTVCVLDDGGNSIRFMVELLDGQSYCVLQDTDVDEFMTTVADVDPELIVIPETAPATDVNFIPMLRLFTDNIIAVAGCNDSVSAASTLMQGADLFVPQAMRDAEVMAMLRVFERRLLAPSA
jgi:DNA-binding response OmpR family regulator